MEEPEETINTVGSNTLTLLAHFLWDLEADNANQLEVLVAGTFKLNLIY